MTRRGPCPPHASCSPPPWPAVLALLAALAVAAPVAAQSVRGWAGTRVQAIELRPYAATPGGCVPATPCYVLQPEQTSVVGTQDVSLTAWGLGVQGLSATVFLRGRSDLGSDRLWPRSDDPFDALLGYAQLVRGPWTIRLGRQESRSGLGFASFDGGTAGWRNAVWSVEGFAGRSLARGLREPVAEALEGIEDFVPDQGVYLFGGAAGLRTTSGSMNLRYQRELLADRSGLASERASLDASSRVGRVSLTGGADWDFGRAQPGKAHLSAQSTIGGGRWLVGASARRYVPYFSLSTIWGFFEPVAYHEALGRVGWSASNTLGLQLSGGVRRYGDTGTEQVLSALEDVGRRVEAEARWLPRPGWSVTGRYELEWGPGGFLNSGDARVRWTPTERLTLTGHGMSFQQIEQYRLGDGRALGGGLGVEWAGLADRFDFSAGGSVIRHDTNGTTVDTPWNQLRLWSAVRARIGSDPGPRNRVRR